MENRKSGAIEKKDQAGGIVFVPGGVCAPAGFRAAGLHAGFKAKSRKPDLALIYSETICDAAAVYTTNKVKGAPIAVTKAHLKNGKARAVVVNSGNANTCAKDGLKIAKRTCAIAGAALGTDAGDILVCSTGVIGKTVPMEPFERGIPKAARIVLATDSGERYAGSAAAAEAIMTTDLIPKEMAAEFTLGGKTCRIGGIAKGSGMINPRMATMLAFVTTDANIDAGLLQAALREDTERSFNQISVDGDTSTNDTLILMANGRAGNRRITDKGPQYRIFAEALNKVTTALARLMAKDGEGATKLIECRVSGAPTEALARRIAKTVVQSDLVKTAVYGSDANWGRILCAVGYTPGRFKADRADISIASKTKEVAVCKSSFGVDFDEGIAKQILDGDEIVISVDLNDGKASAAAYGCDLTYGYVKINGMYRT
ncbi:MAG: bifunctional glutamate N-acetyltransferase/amino-acid acetyltransferase ArgJ [Clostridiales Family XIII bacterium]|jgi:glutamate N-acetyltransferase/amino-acid N-acetyltransferase|nr:bifunctional glutamate N-acetyltransferase/amino-acid acetyltransferase ArgJ [Clostridiales Family XIII bacterium]